MKKLLSLVLAAAMLLSLVPAAFAEEAETKSINGKEYGVDYTSLYSQFGKDTTIADVLRMRKPACATSKRMAWSTSWASTS